MTRIRDCLFRVPESALATETLRLYFTDLGDRARKALISAIKELFCHFSAFGKTLISFADVAMPIRAEFKIAVENTDDLSLKLCE